MNREGSAALLLDCPRSYGAFCAGVVETLVVEGKLDFQVFYGISDSALSAGFLAQAQREEDPTRSVSALAIYSDRLSRLWREKIKGRKSVFWLRTGGFVGPLAGKNSVFDLTPLRRLLSPEIDSELLCSSGRSLLGGVTSLKTGRHHIFWNNPDYREWIHSYLFASASLPFLVEPVEAPPPGDPEAPKEPLADGALSSFPPLQDLLEEKPSRVVVVTCNHGEIPERDFADNFLGTAVGAYNFLERAEEILRGRILSGNLLGVRELVRLKENFLRLKGRLSAESRALMEFKELEERLGKVHICPIQVIGPEEPLEGPLNSFRPAHILKNLEAGHRAARAFLEREEERPPG